MTDEAFSALTSLMDEVMEAVALSSQVISAALVARDEGGRPMAAVIAISGEETERVIEALERIEDEAVAALDAEAAEIIYAAFAQHNRVEEFEYEQLTLF